MSYLDASKSAFLKDLWKPSLFDLTGSPRRNRQLKVLTLTSPYNYEEIKFMISHRMTSWNNVVPWLDNHINGIRLDSVTGKGHTRMFYGMRFEERGNRLSSLISDFCPFDVLNLDFPSQSNKCNQGKCEREFMSLNEIIKLQRQTDSRRFLAILTTELGQYSINFNHLLRDIAANSGSSITAILTKCQNNVANNIDETIECINALIAQVCSDRNYRCSIGWRSIAEGGSTYVSFAISVEE